MSNSILMIKLEKKNNEWDSLYSERRKLYKKAINKHNLMVWSTLNTNEKNSELNLEVTIELLENASNGIMGATKNMLGHLSSLNFEGDVLQEVEERLFSIREMSRKYKVSPNELDDLSIDLSNRLKELESFTDTLEETELRIIGLEKKYNEVAQGLTKNRIIAAKKLDDAMREQLPALKLEQAVFTTSIDSVSSSINGNDKVSFNYNLFS